MMNRLSVFAILVALCFVPTDTAFSNDITVMRNLSSMSLAFTENQGQWDEQVLYRANAGGATMWFTKDCAVYQFTRTVKSEDDGPFSVVDKRHGISAGGWHDVALSVQAVSQ